MPTTSASTTIETSTWRREPPSVLTVANSRVRWAIVIESEFAITKLPTKSAIPANASRKPCRKVMNSFVSAASSSDCCSAEITCVFSGSTSRIWPASSASETPARAATAISSSLPSLSKSRCAVSRSKPARVAPPIDPTEPKVMIPEIRRRSSGPAAWTPTSSPTSKSSLPAVSASTTTSFGPGQLPSTRLSGLNCESPFAIEKPRFGAPP